MEFATHVGLVAIRDPWRALRVSLSSVTSLPYDVRPVADSGDAVGHGVPFRKSNKTKNPIISHFYASSQPRLV